MSDATGGDAPDASGGPTDLAARLRHAVADAARSLGSEVVASRSEPARSGRFAELPPDLPPALRAALAERGIVRAYAHQRTAYDAWGEGRDVLVTTGTASGKSLPYQLRIVTDLSNDLDATALLLFPTKALAHDQAASLKRLARDAGWPDGAVALYDGDLPTHRRRAVRGAVRVLVTNPDMLHAGILPHHALWARWAAGLHRIVIDELHAYRGVFGGHLAGVLRRLRRIAWAYGARPTVYATSATLGNPVEHAARVIGGEVLHLDRDDAPRPGRELRVVRPPWLDRELGLRRPPLAEAASLAERLAHHGLQVLVFADGRQGVEEAVVQLRGRMDGVRAYRSGLLPAERRAIEAELADGRARVVVATNALELGIDVGGMDAVVSAGWPGSTSAFRQRIGRAGRGTAPGLGVLVLGSDPLDAYLAQHPEVALGAPSERVLTDPDHLLLALDHLRCAVFERPLAPGERFGGFDGEQVALLAEQLVADGEAHRAEGRTYWIGERYPAERVSLRSAVRDEVRLVTMDGASVGQVDGPSARWMTHPGAVYLHDGTPYRVETLDLERREARLAATDDRFATRATRTTEVRPEGPTTDVEVPGATVRVGEVSVTDTVTGYRLLRRATREMVERRPLELPPYRLRTRAYAVVPHDPVVATWREQGAWTSDPNAYGPGWPRLRARIVERDGHACRHCGTRAAAGGPLHVHHLVPFRAFADRRDANREANLVTLCPACHRQAERGVRIRSGLAAVAHVVRSLAPLIVTCDARDLGVTADPASAIANGRPAWVIHETVPGGVGLVDVLAERHEVLMRAARERVRDCPCRDGCPSCVGPAGEEGHAGKDEAAALLAVLAPEGARSLGDPPSTTPGARASTGAPEDPNREALP
ncbi:MAG: DEAD/DEAH box helicase [Trueperaceae bacterium]